MNEKELEKLIDAYADTIRAVCRRYFLVGGSQEDLFQEGMIGLLEACKKYDFSKGDYTSSTFKKFAMLCIKRQIIDAIKHANTKKNQPLNNYVSFNQKNDENQEFELEFDNSYLNYLDVDPETIVLKQETTDEQLNILKQTLSKGEGQVLELYLRGLSQSKIAKDLNKTPKQIDNTIQRIKNKAKNFKNG